MNTRSPGRRIVDLTHPLADGTAGYPGDPGLRVERAHEHSEQGYRVSEFHTGSHVGTHIDVPLHVFPGGADVVDVGLEPLVGPAIVRDLGALEPFAEIGVDDVGEVPEGARLLLRTGWASRFGTAGYHDGFPQVSPALAAHLAERRVRLLGLEQPSVHLTHGLEVHHVLLGAGIVIVEGMRLTDLPAGEVELVCLPLAVRGADGSPVRAIALVADGDAGTDAEAGRA